MLIPLPKVPQSIVRVIVGDNEYHDVIQGTQAQIDVPEGVRVMAVGLGGDNKPVGEPFVVLAGYVVETQDEPEADAEAEVTTGPHILLGQTTDEIVSPFKSDIEKKGGPFRGPQAKGL